MLEVSEAYEVVEGLGRVDFARVHGWLTAAYWSLGVSRNTVERAAQHSSLVLGAYTSGGAQVGYLRVVSDRATSAWICDVYVDEGHRGRGIATAMPRFALGHPQHQELRRWLLATADAHSLYAASGFAPLPSPERWMFLAPPRKRFDSRTGA